VARRRIAPLDVLFDDVENDDARVTGVERDPRRSGAGGDRAVRDRPAPARPDAADDPATTPWRFRVAGP
jgi:hypothetical protein